MTDAHRATRHRVSYIELTGGDQPIVEHLDVLSVDGWEPFHLHEAVVDGKVKLMVVSRGPASNAQPHPPLEVGDLVRIYRIAFIRGATGGRLGLRIRPSSTTSTCALG